MFTSINVQKCVAYTEMKDLEYQKESHLKTDIQFLYYNSIYKYWIPNFSKKLHYTIFQTLHYVKFLHVLQKLFCYKIDMHETKCTHTSTCAFIWQMWRLNHISFLEVCMYLFLYVLHCRLKKKKCKAFISSGYWLILSFLFQCLKATK